MNFRGTYSDILVDGELKTVHETDLAAKIRDHLTSDKEKMKIIRAKIERERPRIEAELKDFYKHQEEFLTMIKKT